MSNNKLYTEEQVKHAIKMARSSYNLFTTPFIYEHDEVLEKLTPIELPSHEEIQKEADTFHQLESYNKAFVQGGRLVLEKYKEVTNEQQ